MLLPIVGRRLRRAIIGQVRVARQGGAQAPRACVRFR
jgi:hypothetical protein